MPLLIMLLLFRVDLELFTLLFEAVTCAVIILYITERTVTDTAEHINTIPMRNSLAKLQYSYITNSENVI